VWERAASRRSLRVPPGGGDKVEEVGRVYSTEFTARVT